MAAVLRQTTSQLTRRLVHDTPAGLAPQELVLLYLILQISECNENPIKDL